MGEPRKLPPDPLSPPQGEDSLSKTEDREVHHMGDGSQAAATLNAAAALTQQLRSTGGMLLLCTAVGSAAFLGLDIDVLGILSALAGFCGNETFAGCVQLSLKAGVVPIAFIAPIGLTLLCLWFGVRVLKRGGRKRN